MKTTPLIIPNFNQLTYLKNLINWWKWYYPDYPIYVIDNGSTYEPLLDYYKYISQDVFHNISKYPENTFIPNLTDCINRYIKNNFDYYVISDPDIMPNFDTPLNFIDIWISRLEEYKLHRIGFNLITNDIPDYNKHKPRILCDEGELLKNKLFEYNGFTGWKAPVDTTFALYSTKNNGWYAPMNGEDWGNCVRLFNARHLPWYLNGNELNEEMKYYFANCKTHIPGQPSAGSNNYKPIIE